MFPKDSGDELEQGDNVEGTGLGARGFAVEEEVKEF